MDNLQYSRLTAALGFSTLTEIRPAECKGCTWCLFTHSVNSAVVALITFWQVEHVVHEVFMRCIDPSKVQ